MRQIQLVLPRLFAVAALVIGLSACGGESGNLPPDRPDFSDSDLRLSVGPRQLLLQWDTVPGALYYRLFENPDGQSGFTQLGDDIPVGGFPAALEVSVDDDNVYSATIDIAVHLFDWANARYRLESCDSDGCTLVGEQGTPGLSFAAIRFIKTATEFQASFGYAIALSENGGVLAGGAIGSSTAVYLQTGIPATSCDEQDVPVIATTDDDGNTVFLYEDDTPVDEDEIVAACPRLQSSGTVAVFDLAAEDFAVDAFIKAPNADEFDVFGTAVDISDNGNVLVVSATGEDSSKPNGLNDNEAESAGAVYVYGRDGEGNWPLPGEGATYIKAPLIEAEDFFGSSVAISGDGSRLAIAAIGESSSATGVTALDPEMETVPAALQNNDAEESGAVYIYRASFGNWVPEAYIKASNTDAEDFFGLSISLNKTGDVLAVSAPGESAANANDQSNNSKPASGAVYVFGRDGTDWSQLDFLKASNADAALHSGDPSGDSFGASVSLSADGSLLLVGAPNEDSNAVGVDGNLSDNSARNAGAAYLFARNGDAWDQQTYFKASNTGDIDEFGSSVEISSSGNFLVIAAQRESSSSTGINGTQNIDNVVASGAAYFFEKRPSRWRQKAYIKSSTPNFGMLFGWDVELAQDGDILAGSAPSEDGTVTDSGAVFLY